MKIKGKEIHIDNLAMFLVKHSVTILVVLCLLIHIFFSVLFLVVDIKELVLLNVVSSSIYTVLLLTIKKCRAILVATLTFAEIVIYMVMSTFVVGIGSGFFLYPIAMIPVMFFLTDVLKPKETYPFICAGFGTLATAVLAFAAAIADPIYERPIINFVLLIINILIAAAINITFSYIFVHTSSASRKHLQEKNELLDYLSSYDPLTNLYNRRAMKNMLKDNQSKMYAICLCDIDDFKMVNDVYGHSAGDMILKSVAKIHSESVENGCVCRWGGEEILILLKDLGKKEAISKIDDIRKSIEKEIHFYGGNSFNITMTYGLAMSDECEDVDSMIKKADERLYIGKRNGKNCVIY